MSTSSVTAVFLKSSAPRPPASIVLSPSGKALSRSPIGDAPKTSGLSPATFATSAIVGGRTMTLLSFWMQTAFCRQRRCFGSFASRRQTHHLAFCRRWTLACRRLAYSLACSSSACGWACVHTRSVLLGGKAIAALLGAPCHHSSRALYCTLPHTPCSWQRTVERACTQP